MIYKKISFHGSSCDPERILITDATDPPPADWLTAEYRRLGADRH